MRDRAGNRSGKIIGRILTGAGLCLVLAALLLVLYNRLDAYYAAKDAAYFREHLETAMEEYVPEELSLEEESALIGGDEQDTEMPVISIDGYDCIGLLSVPEYELTLPVMSTWDYERLKKAPCRYSGSVYTGDLVICGHNYPQHFSNLKQIPIGSQISFVTVDGTRWLYEVSNIETLEPEQIDRMTGVERTDAWDMTLFTCTTGGQARCAIRCYLIDTEETADSTS